MPAGAPRWDAIVVGSGATGTIAAQILARGGMHVLVCEAGPVTPMQSVPLASPRASHRPGLLRLGRPRIWRIFLWSLTQSTRCGNSFEPCPLKHSLGPLRSSPRNICVDRAMARFLTARSRLRPFE